MLWERYISEPGETMLPRDIMKAERMRSILIMVLLVISVVNSFAIVGLWLEVGSVDDDHDDGSGDNTTGPDGNDTGDDHMNATPPTYVGQVHSKRCFFSEAEQRTMTIIRIDDNISFAVYGEHNYISLFAYYRFWVDGYVLVKYEEITK
jgi:hypothetical protein